jgi:catechol 2,3-dioxygenase-like lactoylglutathione lyase family enzyme
MIRGVKFVSIPVTDQERALHFYTHSLGFRILTDQPFNDSQRWLELGIPGADTRVVLFRAEKSIQPGSFMNLSFWTDDLEATVAEMQANQVEFTSLPTKAQWGSFAIFQDPDGNSFVLSAR